MYCHDPTHVCNCSLMLGFHVNCEIRWGQEALPQNFVALDAAIEEL